MADQGSIAWLFTKHPGQAQALEKFLNKTLGDTLVGRYGCQQQRGIAQVRVEELAQPAHRGGPYAAYGGKGGVALSRQAGRDELCKRGFDWRSVVALQRVEGVGQ